MRVMLPTPPPLDKMTDRRLWIHYLPATTIVGTENWCKVPFALGDNDILYVPRYGLHGYQCYWSHITNEKKNKIIRQRPRCRQVRTVRLFRDTLKSLPWLLAYRSAKLYITQTNISNSWQKVNDVISTWSYLSALHAVNSDVALMISKREVIAVLTGR